MNNESIYKVQPQVVVTSQTIVSFKISVLSLVLDSYVQVNAMCYDSNNNLIKAQLFLIEGQEYQNWQNDDYLVDLVAKKIGLNLANTVPSVTETSVTETPVTETSVTEPSVTETPVTEPSVTEPSVTEPSVTEPSVTEPSVTEPLATEPSVTEPSVTDPSVTEPSVTDPSVTEPLVSEPSVTKTPVI